MFKHYVCTRWNLGLYFNNEAPQTWMSERLKLFKAYCLPTMNAQTCKNFTWLIAFDRDTPEFEIDLVTDLIKVDYKIILTDHIPYFKTLNKEAQFLITSRLDNDDFVTETWVEDIQAEFHSRTEIIDFSGIQYDILTGKTYTNNRKCANSPFLSLIELWKTPDTCFIQQHSVMPLHYPGRLIKKYRHAMIIHDNNVCNEITGEEI